MREFGKNPFLREQPPVRPNLQDVAGSVLGKNGRETVDALIGDDTDADERLTGEGLEDVIPLALTDHEHAREEAYATFERSLESALDYIEKISFPGQRAEAYLAVANGARSAHIRRDDLIERAWEEALADEEPRRHAQACLHVAKARLERGEDADEAIRSAIMAYKERGKGRQNPEDGLSMLQLIAETVSPSAWKRETRSAFMEELERMYSESRGKKTRRLYGPQIYTAISQVCLGSPFENEKQFLERSWRFSSEPMSNDQKTFALLQLQRAAKIVTEADLTSFLERTLVMNDQPTWTRVCLQYLVEIGSAKTAETCAKQVSEQRERLEHAITIYQAEKAHQDDLDAILEELRTQLDGFDSTEPSDLIRKLRAAECLSEQAGDDLALAVTIRDEIIRLAPHLADNHVIPIYLAEKDFTQARALADRPGWDPNHQHNQARIQIIHAEVMEAVRTLQLALAS